MADISRINPNGTEYNLKDATARAGIESSKTVTGNPITVPDAAPINAEDITVDITPQQDLHGFDKPWAGGAGKNKLPMTVAGIKAANNNWGSSWSGNTLVTRGITIDLLTDSGNNLIGIKFNGTSSDQFIFNFTGTTTPYVANTYGGMKSNGFDGQTSPSQYCNIMMYSNDGTHWANEAYQAGGNDTVILSNYDYVSIGFLIRSGQTLNNVVVRPMIRLATETDATFAPYSNICPIEGWTGAELDRVGKNLCDNSQNIWGYYNNIGDFVTSVQNKTSDLISVKANTTYIASIFNRTTLSRVGGLVWTEWDANGNFIQQKTSESITTNENTSYVRVRNFNSDSSLIANNNYLYQLELGSSPTAYEPYQGKQYTADFGETVYGGKWHVTGGGTDKTYGNIASYNGETINEPWLSSMDEYSPGATPTTGAQVVYPLTTPTAISTPKQSVPMLQGINTVSADCGDVSLKYQPDNVIGELKGEIRAVEAELAEVEENLEIVYEDHVANTSMGIIVDGYSVGDMPFSNALDIAKPGYIPIAVTDTSIVHSTVANQGEIATHCLLDVTNNRVRFYVHVMDSAASLTIPPNSLTFRVAYKKA